MYSEVFQDITENSFAQVLGEGDSDASLKTTAMIDAVKLSEVLMNGTAASAENDLRVRDARSQEMTNNINQGKNSEAAQLVALTNEWTDAINTRNRQKLDALMVRFRAIPLER